MEAAGLAVPLWVRGRAGRSGVCGSLRGGCGQGETRESLGAGALRAEVRPLLCEAAGAAPRSEGSEGVVLPATARGVGRSSLRRGATLALVAAS